MCVKSTISFVDHRILLAIMTNSTTTMTVMSRQDVNEIVLAEISNICNISIEHIEDVYACSPLQIATISESAIHTSASVFQFVLSISQAIDIDRFCIALRSVVSLNSVLRTRFVDCRYGILQVVTKERHCTKRLSRDVELYLRQDKAQSLGFGDALFRTAIIDRTLVLTMHHGIMDHASLTPFFEDVMTIYHGNEPEFRAQFKEFVSHCLEVDESEARLFWASRYNGTPAIFPKVELGYLPLASKIVTQKMTLPNMGSGVPLAHIPSVIEAAWTLTASTYTGNDNIAFGLILSGRTSAFAGAQTTLGPTMAIVPIQVNLQHDMTVERILTDRAAARRQLQTQPALQYGITKIQTVSEAAKIASGFQTLLNIRPRWYDPKKSSEITFKDMNEPHGAFALSISFDLEETAILIKAASDPTVLCERQLEKVLYQLEHYIQLLIEASPQTQLDHLPRLNIYDFSDIMKWNSIEHQTRTKEDCLHRLYSAKAKEQPKVIAVESHDGNISYGELDRISSRVAHELQQRGVRTESTIAFISERSLWTVVSLLGIMKAGGACVPIAASDPPARKATLISNAGAKMVLTSSAEHAKLVGFESDIFVISAEFVLSLPEITDYFDCGKGSPNDLAYILFTSGSTGLPKGVMLEHRSLASSLNCLAQRLGWGSGTRTLHFASHVWDASIAEIFGTLLSGGCLCIPSEEVRDSDLAGYIQANKINCAWLTPTVIRTLSPEDVSELRFLLSGGEPVSPGASRTWGRALRFVNGWGPCEASLLGTVAELTPNSPYPESIGTPFNCAIWIINPRNVNDLAPIGAVGEILIEGPGVARGYLKEDAKTKTAFIEPPSWAPSRERAVQHFYRTGDLAKYNIDGSIQFIGRRDHQVKIRGQRLELGEIECVLAGCGNVRDAFITTKICEGRTEVVAVVSLTDPFLPKKVVLQELAGEYGDIATAHLRTIRDYVSSRLPSYMVPSIWLAVEQMPQTNATKIDRISINEWLKTMDLPSARAALNEAMTETLTPPCTAEEKLLLSIWSSVLFISEQDIGRESRFRQLGGDSILAMQTVSRCLKLGLRISVASLLRNIPLAEVAKSSTKIELTSHEGAPPSDTPYQSNIVVEQIAAFLDHVTTRVPQLAQLNQHLMGENVEAIVPATNSQAVMIAVGESGGRGYYIDFVLDFKPSLDVARLRKACERVIHHHSILRTVFLRRGATLYQVVLKCVPAEVVVEQSGDFVPILSFREGAALACFHLISNGQKCRRLHLEIHHALYDAVSLRLIFRDLDLAYDNKPLSNGPTFHSWVSYIEKLDKIPSEKYWETILQDASMPYLVPPVPGAIRGCALDEHRKFCVPIQNMKTSFGTSSSILKSAWSFLLSIALGSLDVVFGEVSTNRYLTIPGIEKVKGPCVNLIPFRAHLKRTTTLASLVAQIQELWTSGIPHHHLETSSIIRNCTRWPRWTRFSTALVYQGHGLLSETLSIGSADASLSSRGKLGDSTDFHVIATPGSKDLEIELRYSSLVFPSQQINWITQGLAMILDFFPSGLDQTLAQVETSLLDALGSYVVPASRGDLPSRILDQNPSYPSVKAQEVVLEAWKEVQLTSNPQSENLSMWDCGANVITALLLSQYYHVSGFNISTEDIIQNPTSLMQSYLVDTRI